MLGETPLPGRQTFVNVPCQRAFFSAGSRHRRPYDAGWPAQPRSEVSGPLVDDVDDPRGGLFEGDPVVSMMGALSRRWILATSSSSS